jgi:hypothetical protein
MQLSSLFEANSALVGKIFEIPDELIEVLQAAYDKWGAKVHGSKSSATEGLKRCERLLKERQLTYYQIKRMIHDMEHINRYQDPIAYALNGGIDMYKWAVRVLDKARRDVDAQKNSRMNANNIGGLNGLRKNAYLSKHEKNGEPLDGIIFGTGDKGSLTPMISEAVNRIKTIINKTTK